MRNAGLDEAQAGINIAGRNINNLRYTDDTTLMAETEEEQKSLLMKEESEKVGLKLNIQKMKIMASGPITSWQIDGETVEKRQTLFWGAPKSLQIVNEVMKLKDTWKKSYDQLRQHIKKQRYYLATKVHLVKAMVLPVVMYRCESWTIKKAEHQRIVAFELWFWRRILIVPWTARRSNQSILMEISSWIFIGRTEAEAETPILWPSDLKNWFIWKDPDARKDWRQKERAMTEDEVVGWHHWLSGREFEWALGVCDEQGGLMCCSPWDCKE